MGDSPPATDSPSPKPRRSPRGILRWLGRFLLRSAAIIAGVLLLFAVIGAVLYVNRVRLLNQTLGLLVEPFRVSIGDLDFYPIGVIRITDLQLAPKGAPADARLATIPEVVVTYRLEELRRTRRLENITLRHPILALDDAMLESLSGKAPSSPATPGGAPEAAPFLLSRLALFTGDLAVEKGRFRVALSSAPEVEGGWSFRTAAIDFEEASGLIRTPFSWDLRDLVVGKDGSGGRIAAFSGQGRVSADLSRIELDPVRLEGAELKITPEFLPAKPASPSATATPAAPADPVPSAHRAKSRELTIRGLVLDGATVNLSGFDGESGRARLPDLSFGISLATPALRLRDGRWDSDGPISLTLSNVQAGSGGGLPFLSAAGIRGEAASLASLIEEHRVTSVAVDSIDFLASDESLARFLQPRHEEPAAPAPTGKPWTIETLTVGEGSVLLRDLTLGGKPGPEFTTALKGTLHDLRFGGTEGFASDGTQSLVLSQTRLRAPGSASAADPLLSLEHVELEGRWSDFQRDNLIDRLVVRGPAIHFTDAALGSWLGGGGSKRADAPGPVNRPVYKARQLEVTGGRLVADSSFAEGKVPKIQAGFVIETVEPREDDPYSYRLRFEELTLRNHARVLDFVGPPAPSIAGRKVGATPGPLAEGEVFRVESIEVDATAAELQRTRRIGKMKVAGAVLTVGEGLQTLAGGKPAAPKPAPAPAPAPQAAAPATPRDLPSWNIGEIEITRSRVHFEAIVPQIEGLQFAIETRLFDIPLSLDGILAQEKLQKIELAGIEIKDPYTSFITVADLPTIFVEFSLAGLARQTVEKIDLIGPSLHVGQGLFWWVDYQRKFREQNEGASLGFETEEPKEKKSGWIIRTINATSGKIVIAPTGVPIGAVPFPFNATTNMSEGNIELKLNIPDEDHVYRFPQYKVEIAGLVGDVQFNVPVEDLNNNLVQTFTLKRAKWKEYEARDLYLTVTFDENGVYGKFGGAAYDGYTEGQFNFYLKDEGKWDAWIAGTGLDTGPITSVIAPETFLMDGKVSLKLVSEGRRKAVGKTSGEFQATTPGWFDVTKLDAMLEKLPPEWNSLQRSLTELGLIALKRFDYDSGSGSLSFLNREGTLDLRFEGDYGTRALRLQAHDERNPNPSAAITTTGNETPPADSSAPLPEASARPVGPTRLAGARSPR